MNEIVGIPSYRREELLYCCLRRVREIEPFIAIHVFPDRGTANNPLVKEICAKFDARIHFVPEHDYYGNSYLVMEMYKWAFNEGCDLFYMLEDDVFVHPDFFSWHRDQHQNFPDIFASMAWVFNRHAPLTNDLLFQPWIYSPGVAFSHNKLALIAPHATPRYYNDMDTYIRKTFPESKLNDAFNIGHCEQDGNLQRILDRDGSQTVSCGIAKCSHMGFVRSYGTGETRQHYEMFLDHTHLSFEQRVEKLESFCQDIYWRATVFGRSIVEREVGHTLPKRELKYKVILPGGWESEFKTEMRKDLLPSRINSVPLPSNAQIVLV